MRRYMYFRFIIYTQRKSATSSSPDKLKQGKLFGLSGPVPSLLYPRITGEEYVSS